MKVSATLFMLNKGDMPLLTHFMMPLSSASVMPGTGTIFTAPNYSIKRRDLTLRREIDSLFDDVSSRQGDDHDANINSPLFNRLRVRGTWN